MTRPRRVRPGTRATLSASARDTLHRSGKAFRALAPYGRPHRRYLAQGGIATVLLVAARLAFPWPLRGLMDIVFRHGKSGRAAVLTQTVPAGIDPMWWFVGWFVAIIVLWGATESWQRLAFTRLAVGLVRDARAAALRNLPRVNQADPGGVLATITGDAARVKTGLRSLLVGTSRNGAFFLGVTVIVSLIDPLIGAVFLTGGLASAAVGAVGAWRSSRPARRSRRKESAFTAEIYHYLTGATAPPAADERPDRAPDSKVTRIEGWTTFSIHLVLAAATCTILVLTISAGRRGALSSGSVFTVIAYVLLMHNKTVSIGRRINRTGRLLASAERLGQQASHSAATGTPTDAGATGAGLTITQRLGTAFGPAPTPAGADR